MSNYRVYALVESDKDEEQLAMFIEGLLMQHRWHFQIQDLSVHEVTA